MRVRDLGTLAVGIGNEERPVTGVRAAAMLALLTINANQRVSVDALMDAAWGERVTTGAASALESHVWRLRQLLEPGRARRAAPTVLISDAGGYRLIVENHAVDSLLLAELAGEVRNLLAAGRASEAVARADRALALWRGRPFGALGDQEWARPAVARLDELHGQVRERRVEALLATGDLDRVLSDVEPLVAALPFRESLRGLQMLALFRRGRGEEALQAYQRARRALVAEIGTEPGTELQELHRRILDNDPTLIGPVQVEGQQIGATARVVEVHLPAALTPLIGREDVRRQIDALMGRCRLVTVVGAAGCGKTRVAVEVARARAAAFPDGVWFVDLGAVSDRDLVVDVVVSTIGFAPSPTGTPLQDLRDYVRGRRVLLVLDNCEHLLPSVAQIVETVLAEPVDAVECGILATSREPVGLDGEAIWTLEPLRLPDSRVELLPQAAPAVELFLQRMRAVVPTLVVDEHVVARAAEICSALDGLPLPIELAAARARSYTLDDIAAQVSTDPGGLSRLNRRSTDHRATVRSAIEWSHRLLTRPEQVAHRRMAVLPGPFTRPMAAAVIGDMGLDDGAPADVDDLLAQLVHRSMLVSDGARRSGGPTLFRQLATVRSHAQHALVDAGEEAEVGSRRDAWTAALLGRRPRLGSVGEIAWYQALDDGYATVRATLARHLIDEPAAVGARLAARLQFYWYYRARLVEGTRWLHLAYDVIGDGDPDDVLLTTVALATALLVQGRVDRARLHVDAALDRLPLASADRLPEVAEGLVGLAASAWLSDAIDLVGRVHSRLVGVVGLVGDADLAVLADAVGCLVSVGAGRLDEAVRDAERVYARAMALGNITASWIAAGPPMFVAMLAGRPEEGVPWVNRLMRGHTRLGTGGSGLYIENRANFAAQAGDYREAARLYAAAHIEARRAAMVWPDRRRQLTRQLQDLTRSRLDPADYRRAWQEGERLSVRDIFPPDDDSGCRA